MIVAPFLTLASLALAVSTTLAHFTLDYPSSRGLDEDTESTGPCGGFNTPNTTLTPWYYKDGPVEIDSHHDTATVQVFLGKSSASTLSDFHGNNLTEPLPITGRGEFCFKVNASSSARSANTTAVLMVEHISIHGHPYQCSDVIFSHNASVGSDIACTNSLTARTGNEADGNQDEGDKFVTSGVASPSSVLSLYTSAVLCLAACAVFALL